ncbi:hypothetical protein C9E82_12650 [Paracoccus siganidrum]|uniref:Uncharacterized protein n=1 Tax=Paracoccus siganidrum TaxID=1276757 RepID=A0A418ZPL3_9RHOB|nr:hypothetical protein D3P05_24410 [Paracoccus siganidrum]RMC34012.1 hypothetical protein C9E82_12650 [Paracoccus siganidrum]
MRAPAGGRIRGFARKRLAAATFPVPIAGSAGIAGRHVARSRPVRDGRILKEKLHRMGLALRSRWIFQTPPRQVN